MTPQEERENRQLWLDHLTTGDEVAVRERARMQPSTFYLSRVTRTTPTQISIMDKYGRLRKFRRSGGGQVGASWGDELELPTDKVREDMRKQSIHDRFRTVVTYGEKNLTLEERAAMLAAYDTIHAEKT